MRTRLLAALTLSLFSLSAQAVPIFVGSYAVWDGPVWTTNPTVYSAREAAALVFGGSFTDYAVSINGSLDYTTITNTGWYDGWGEHSGMIFDHDYKLDVGGVGYNNPGGLNTARSAYVRDGLNDTQRFRNYVWRLDPVAVPEPTAMALFGLGLLPLAFAVRRRLRG